ncbi:NAD+-dependent deacetylase [Heterostelium album PN500]|uniref:NAD+-dependent deacetylase n=1 Tax=Heterostelium pallidum (strain ATCC 26659 / Pp 5 / PN500) TaxID=670386 RepID=D3BL62_HETP5|nr:NAD+-dependent deacetylase [Heterostelium album PN500]EFA77796.1 NAD+-dependent deacetylase [Heterostelium album PN500]|eukprot:XP_020429924.1 NAD+-dependent deacetylase [Heterostelium album PN500]
MEAEGGGFYVQPIACKHLLDSDLREEALDIGVFDGADCIILQLLISFNVYYLFDDDDDDLVSRIACGKCDDESENWVCLKCRAIGCSRYVQSHASDHFDTCGHPISASFSDHSVWCYLCQEYLEHYTLAPFLDILNTIKFFKEKEEKKIEPAAVAQSTTTIISKEQEQTIGEDGTTITSTTSTTTTTTTTSNVGSGSSSSTTFISSSSSSTTYTAEKDLAHDFESSESEDESLSDQKSGLLQKMLGLFIGNNKSAQALDGECNLKSIANYIKSGKAKNIIVLTGAGISVAAGIPDFRSPKTGLYHNLAKFNLPYKTAIFDLEYFVENPKPFFVLAKELYPGGFNPTEVHHFIKLLHEKGLLLRNYTQNIDTLERVAGIPETSLVEAHGTFATAKCLKCRKSYTCEYVREIIFRDELPVCECSGIIKPDIVFFGEALPSRFHDLVREDFPKCDLLLVLGTSLQVQPFASLVSLAPQGIPRCLINLEEVGANPYGGFKFGDANNKTDVKWIGDCQEGIIELAQLLGWKEELLESMKKKI